MIWGQGEPRPPYNEDWHSHGIETIHAEPKIERHVSPPRFQPFERKILP